MSQSIPAAQKEETPTQPRNRARYASFSKVIVALAALIGVLMETVITGVFQGNSSSLCTYSVQSNLIIAVVFAASAVQILKGYALRKSLAMIERSARLWICVTGLGYHFLLSQYGHPTGLQGVSNILLHYAVPIGTFASWLLVEQKGCYRLREVLIWVSYPLIYLGGSLLRARFDGIYLYWFLDPDKAAPTGGVLLWAGGLTAALIAMGCLLTGLDAILARFQRKQQAM